MSENKPLTLKWQSELMKLQAENGTLPSYLILSLIESMYMTDRIIKNLNQCGYDLELDLNNNSNSKI